MTFEQASDDIQSMMMEAWLTTTFQVFWESVRGDRDTGDDPWACAFVRHASGEQATLGGRGNRSFNRNGVLIVQIFTPVGKGLHESYRLAKVVTDAFEGNHSPLGVWFRRVRINEQGKDGQFQQLNVTVEFEYNEVK